MSQNLRVVVLAPNPGGAAALDPWLEGDGLDLVAVVSSRRELLDRALPRQPQVVIMLFPEGAATAAPPDHFLALLAELAVSHPQIGRVVLLTTWDFDACRAALRAGADEVLMIPDEGHQLVRALQQAAAAGERRARVVVALAPGEAGSPAASGATGSPKAHLGRLVAFWSARGGAGKTTLAAGTALALTYQGARRVLLVDLDLAVGGVEVPLDLRPVRTLLDLQPVVRELDWSHLERVVVPHASGLLVLCGGAGPGAREALDAEELRLLLRACRRHFDLVVVDLPTALGPPSHTALQEADSVIYVVTPDLPAVRALGQVLRALDREEAREPALEAMPPLFERRKLTLVLNRASRVAEISRREIESLAQVPLAAEIRSDFRTVQACLGRGRPLVHPSGRHNSALGRELIRLAELLGG